jgi:diguanylate cyclase (GGDEF)-like protein
VETDLEVHGALLCGLTAASQALDLLPPETPVTYRPDRWYPIAELNRALAVVQNYSEPGPVLRQIGIVMIAEWHTRGPGGALVHTGLDFLRHQAGSGGFHGVVRGPAASTGEFTLTVLDEQAGCAEVHSTTPFPYELEAGILLGGLAIGGQLLYYDVDACPNGRYTIRFVTAGGLAPAWHDGPQRDLMTWRLLHAERMHGLSEQFWRAIHATLKSAYAQMHQFATRDTLTGVYNKREFRRLAELEFERARRHGHELTIFYLDIDRFKSVNDRYGHDCGDDVITAVGQLYSAECRGADLIGRVGGDEFAILCPQTDEQEALVLAERLLQTTCGLQVPTRQGVIGITTSFGIAFLREQHACVDDLIVDADRALLQAKRAGRNRVVAHTTA